MPRPAAIALWCAVAATLAAGGVRAQDRSTNSTDPRPSSDAIAIVPDPAAATPADGTPGSVRLPPLPQTQPVTTVQPRAPAARQAGAAVVTGPAGPAPAADAPMVAPSPAPLAATATDAVATVPVRPAPAVVPPPERQAPPGQAARMATTAAPPARPGAIAQYVIHRDGRLWRVRRQGETATARETVDLGGMRLAPAIASAARAGLVTLFVDARPVGSRLVVTALAGSVPDRAGPGARTRTRARATRWALRR